MAAIAVATSSTLAADAAREIAAAGGNAVDCALAASLLTMNTEPGVCALAGGAYITIAAPGEPPVTIDGNVAMPGEGVAPERRGEACDAVTMEYGGGITTLVGAGTVAVPGSLAAVERAWQRYGRAPWPQIVAPSIRAARDGFPISKACHYYLGYSGHAIFGRSEDGYRALHDGDQLRPLGSRIHVPHLAESLMEIARDGARSFYEGPLADKIAAHCQDSGGLLSKRDLENYVAIERPALETAAGEWTIATNPPPAVGGVMLAAMLKAFAEPLTDGWNAAAVTRLVEVQRACLEYRKFDLDLSPDVAADAQRLLDDIDKGHLPRTSGSTVHTSAVDRDGLACAITASSGYGAGEMPPGTGLWLNNCVGELELNRRGFDLGPPGTRLPSNMAPSIARRGKQVLAVGSPGADRITTALLQFFINALALDMSLDEAVRHPRAHVDTSGEQSRLAIEPKLPEPDVDLPVRRFDSLNMYFGGVGVAAFDPSTGFAVAADPRREGATLCIPEA